MITLSFHMFLCRWGHIPECTKSNIIWPSQGTRHVIATSFPAVILSQLDCQQCFLISHRRFYALNMLRIMSTFAELWKMELRAWSERLPSWDAELRETHLLPSQNDIFTILNFVALFSFVGTTCQYVILPWVARRFFKQKTQRECMKFSDASWNLLYYFVMTIWEVSTCLSHPWALQLDYFDGQPNHSMTYSMKYVYMVQLGYYLFSLAALAFLPQHHRKDSAIMVFHHIITIGIVTLSYCTKYGNAYDTSLTVSQ